MKKAKAKKNSKAKVAKPLVKETHYLLILDRSGSMQSVADVTVSGFNENVDKIKSLSTDYPDQKFTVSLVMFNHDIEEVCWLENSDSDKLTKLTVEKYKPEGMTHLYNTVGYAVNKIKKDLESKMKDNKEVKVIVSIFTDGQDTAYGQGDYVADSVAKLNAELQKTDQWTFTYIGANHDVYAVAKSLNIPMTNSMFYTSDAHGTQVAFQAQISSLGGYAHSRSVGKDVKDCFYTDADKKEEDKK